MKKALFFLLTLVLCVVYAFSLASCGGTEPDIEGISYTLSKDGKHYIISRVGKVEGGIVEIPETYNGLPVKEIGKDAFKSDNIKKITLPNTITELPQSAFIGCSSVESITLPNGIKSIPKGAFSSCHKLQDLKIPDSVEFVSTNAFDGCEKLVEVIDNIKYVDIWAIGFDRLADQSTNLTFRDGTVGVSDGFSSYDNGRLKVTIPDSVKYFHSCIKAAHPDCLTETPDGAQYIGKWLYSIRGINRTLPFNIKDGTVGVMPEAFNTTMNTMKPFSTELNIPASVMFMYSIPYNTEKINVSESNPYFKSVDGVLYSKDGKTLICYPKAKPEKGDTINIPDGVTEIADNGFRYCFAGTVILPSSIEKIGEQAFQSQFIKNISIPNKVKEIGNGAFDACGFTEITIPSSVTSIGINIFTSCPNLTNITFEDTNNWVAKDASSDKVYSIDLSDPVKNLEYFKGNTIVVNGKKITIEKWIKQ